MALTHGSKLETKINFHPSLPSLASAVTVDYSVLGTAMPSHHGVFDVSALFGGTAIESFNLSAMLGKSIGLQSISYEVSVVPLPADLPLYGAGLVVIGFVGWRKKRKTSATA
ncbi:MAG: hypothetical protein V7750_01175 [Sneathiella sp.]